MTWVTSASLKTFWLTKWTLRIENYSSQWFKRYSKTKSSWFNWSRSIRFQSKIRLLWIATEMHSFLKIISWTTRLALLTVTLRTWKRDCRRRKCSDSSIWSWMSTCTKTSMRLRGSKRSMRKVISILISLNTLSKDRRTIVRIIRDKVAKAQAVKFYQRIRSTFWLKRKRNNQRCNPWVRTGSLHRRQALRVVHLETTNSLPSRTLVNPIVVRILWMSKWLRASQRIRLFHSHQMDKSATTIKNSISQLKNWLRTVKTQDRIKTTAPVHY